MQELEAQLLELGYVDLFLRQSHENLEQVWQQPDAPEKLVALALDDEADAQARLLASEILLHKNAIHPPDKALVALVAVYCHALATATSGNAWALPGHFVGTLGKHLLRFGTAAIEPLSALLENETSLHYEGSETATVGNRLKLRVKDLAAFFIAQLKMIPLALTADSAERDSAIRELKQQIHID